MANVVAWVVAAWAVVTWAAAVASVVAWAVVVASVVAWIGVAVVVAAATTTGMATGALEEEAAATTEVQVVARAVVDVAVAVAGDVVVVVVVLSGTPHYLAVDHQRARTAGEAVWMLLLNAAMHHRQMLPAPSQRGMPYCRAQDRLREEPEGNRQWMTAGLGNLLAMRCCQRRPPHPQQRLPPQLPREVHLHLEEVAVAAVELQEQETARSLPKTLWCG